jgi:MFS family permease
MLNKNRAMLLLITVFNDAAINLIIFFATRYMAEHGAGLIRLGITGGIFSISFAVSSIVFGQLSDKNGRKKSALAGIGLIFLGMIGCLLIEPTRSLFLIFYIFMGISMGLLIPALIGWLGDDADTQSRISQKIVSGRLLLFSLSWNAGVIIGMMSGGRLYQQRMNGPVIASLILISINLVLIIFCKEEQKKKEPLTKPEDRNLEPRDTLLNNSNNVPKDFHIHKRLASLAAMGSACCMSTIFYLFPQIAVEIGLPAGEHGTILALIRGTVIATYLIMHFFSFWRYNPTVMIAIEAAGVIGLLLVFSSSSLSLIIPGLLLIGFLNGYGYFAGLYYGNQDSHSTRKGQDSGLHQGFLGFGVAGGSVLGGLVGKLFGSSYPFLLSAVILLLIMGIQTFTVLKQKGSLRRT